MTVSFTDPDNAGRTTGYELRITKPDGNTVNYWDAQPGRMYTLDGLDLAAYGSIPTTIDIDNKSGMIVRHRHPFKAGHRLRSKNLLFRPPHRNHARRPVPRQSQLLRQVFLRAAPRHRHIQA